MNNIPSSILQSIKNLLTFQEEKAVEGFILTDDAADETPQDEVSRGKDIKKPIRVKRLDSSKKKSADRERSEDTSLDELLVDPDLKTNKEYIEKIYSLPKNKDIIVRDFVIDLEQPVKAFAVFLEGLSDNKVINLSVLKPLMVLSKFEKDINTQDIADYIKNHILYGNQVDLTDDFRKIIDMVNYGGTAVFIDGSSKCLLVETKGWDRRSVSKPETEQVIRGPHEAFNETLRSNTGLIRKAIRNEKLITEMFKLGKRNRTDVAIMYLEDIVNAKLLKEVKRRIESIDTDYVGDSGVLEQFIEDHPFMATPSVLATERPDRVASFLADGKIAILIDGNPNVLIVPTTIFSMVHSAEDYYLRMPYSNMVRILRVAAIFIAIMTPSIYVAITTFHQEMIPTELILAIAASRQTVPFPTLVELFLMEFAFELIREAGVRVPGVVGNTLGIVGALILGQAAVEAGIVSPILIIVVAVTGLASFAIPNYSMSFAFRGIRFLFTILAAIFGFLGVSAGLFIILTNIASMKSFGVPLLSPIGPRSKSSPDIVVRGPIWSMEVRPEYAAPQEKQKQPQISRGWVKSSQEEKEKDKKDE